METLNQEDLSTASFEAQKKLYAKFSQQIVEETARREKETQKLLHQFISEFQESGWVDFKTGSPQTDELLAKADAQVGYNETVEEKIAYEILCKVLDKLNSDIRELTDKLKMSLDRLDALEVAGKIK